MKAIFTREFHYTRSAPPRLGWGATPSPEPQLFPREFIQAAVRAGAATLVPTRRKAAPDPTPRD